MAPDTQSSEHEHLEDEHLQEQFTPQVEDRSLPAQEILAGQQEGRAADEPPALFVP